MTRIGITGFAAVSAVGGNGHQIAASVRAGLSRAQASRFVTRAGEEIVLALHPAEDLGGDLPLVLPQRQRRALGLLREAATQLSQPMDAVVLALPLPADQSVRAQVEARVRALWPSCSVECLDGGCVAGFRALQRAQALVAVGKRVVVGGADSACDPIVLLDPGRRQPVRTMERDGVVLGEAAALLFLENVDGGTCLGAIVEAEEPIDREGRSKGAPRALSQCVRQVVGESAIAAVCTSSAGGPQHPVEWGYAYHRVASRLAVNHRWIAPAESHGDVGAAAAAMLCGIVSVGHHRGWIDGDALVLGHEMGARAAAMIHRSR